MVSNQIIQKSMADLQNITGVEFCVLDATGQYIFGSEETYRVDVNIVNEFVSSEADSQAVGNIRFLKMGNENEGMYIVITEDKETSYTVGKIAVSQLKQLNDAYQDKMDKNSFYQNLILDNMLLVDIHNKAKRLHLECAKKRVVLSRRLLRDFLRFSWRTQSRSFQAEGRANSCRGRTVMASISLAISGNLGESTPLFTDLHASAKISADR